MKHNFTSLQPLNYRPRNARKPFPTKLILIILGILVLLALLVFGAVQLYKNVVQTDPVDKYKEVVESAKPTPDFSAWQFYQNPDNDFSIRIPPEWMINEKRDSKNNSLGEIAFAPSKEGKLYGSVNQIIIKNLPNGIEKEKMTTQNEFDAWYGQQTKEENNIIKLDNETIVDQQGIIYLDTSQDEGYNLNAWFRKDNRNYYITVIGNKNIDDADIYAFKNLLNTIKFISK